MIDAGAAVDGAGRTTGVDLEAVVAAQAAQVADGGVDVEGIATGVVAGQVLHRRKGQGRAGGSWEKSPASVAFTLKLPLRHAVDQRVGAGGATDHIVDVAETATRWLCPCIRRHPDVTVTVTGAVLPL